MPGDDVLRVLVFGSSNLGAEHVEAVMQALQVVARSVGEKTKLVLVHADDAPGSKAGAIGAGRLAEVAARFAWLGRERGLRRLKDPVRNVKKPFRAVCFHTEEGFEKLPGSSAAATAQALRREGVGFLLVLLDGDGQVVRQEDRR